MYPSRIYYYQLLILLKKILIALACCIYTFSLLIGEENGEADDLPRGRLPAALLAASKAAVARSYPHGVSYKRNTTARGCYGGEGVKSSNSALTHPRHRRLH